MQDPKDPIPQASRVELGQAERGKAATSVQTRLVDSEQAAVGAKPAPVRDVTMAADISRPPTALEEPSVSESLATGITA